MRYRLLVAERFYSEGWILTHVALVSITVQFSLNFLSVWVRFHLKDPPLHRQQFHPWPISHIDNWVQILLTFFSSITQNPSRSETIFEVRIYFFYILFHEKLERKILIRSYYISAHFWNFLFK